MTTFTEAILLVDHRLRAAKIPFAFGGALALMFCTGEPRTTADLDVNVFLPASEVDLVLQALEPDVTYDRAARQALQRDGQARLWVDRTALDLFFSTSPFHETISSRVVTRELWGAQLPFLGCSDLAVFKAFFNRRKDWADLEAMVAAEMIDTEMVVEKLAEYLGDDERVSSFEALVAELAQAKNGLPGSNKRRGRSGA